MNPRLDEKAGCLGFLFPDPPTHGPVPPGKPQLRPREKLIFQQRGWLLTAPELHFYHALRQAVGDRYVIAYKVRLFDLVTFVRGLDASTRYTWLNKTNQKHVDFVLCDPRSMVPLIVIELDDESHRSRRNESTEHSDAVKNMVLRQANLRLLRIPAMGIYDVAMIQQFIKGANRYASIADTKPELGHPAVVDRRLGFLNM